MSQKNGSITSFFKKQPIQQPTPTRERASTPTHEQPVIQTHTPQKSFPQQHIPIRLSPIKAAPQKVIRSSDDDDSDSDCSLEDLNELLRAKSAAHATQFPSKPVAPLPSAQRRDTRTRGKASNHKSPQNTGSKYKFDLKSLAKQEQEHRAVESSVSRINALFVEEELQGQPAKDVQDAMLQSNHHEILKSLLADKEDTSAHKVMGALRRTEAIHTGQRFRFFDSARQTIMPARFPSIDEGGDTDIGGWQQGLRDPFTRNEAVLSGFTRDMISMGDTLPDELFTWILDQAVFEVRDDLRQSYFEALIASTNQTRRLINPKVIDDIFIRLGATPRAVDIIHKLSPSSSDPGGYDGRDWTPLCMWITFFGQITKYINASTAERLLVILMRLCGDTVVMDNIDLFASVQQTIEALVQNPWYNTSGSPEPTNLDSLWNTTCFNICSSIYQATDSPVVRLQILRCIPPTTPRLHDLRQHLALAFVLEDLEYTSRPTFQTGTLEAITRALDGPRFTVNAQIDYISLAALIAILDIAVDDGLLSGLDLTDPGVERAFNEDVDALTRKIRFIWSSINDSGAAFISRIDAKEVMEGVRHRLAYAVRSKPMPVRSVFDEGKPDESIQIKKQSELMSKFFKRESSKSSSNGVKMDASSSPSTLAV